MTPEPALKADIEQPQRESAVVNTTLSNLISSIGSYFGNLSAFSGPVLTLADPAAQPWLTLGAATPAPDAGSPTPAGTAAAFFVRGLQAPVGALVKGAVVTFEDEFVPDWNYGYIQGDFVQADFDAADFKIAGYTRAARP